MESAHFPHADVQKIAKTNKFKQRHFILTKTKIYVDMYFVDLQKYKLTAAHCHYVYSKNYFDKN